jgi:PucR family transcriptional regulator, purine catabolism regulatory protein
MVMPSERLPLQPTLRQLLTAEALSEAQVLFGEQWLDRQVRQVIAGSAVGVSAGSLLVTRDELSNQDGKDFEDLAGIVLIHPMTTVTPQVQKGVAITSLALSIEAEQALKVCKEASAPLLLLPSLGTAMEVADEIRAAYLLEVKEASSRLHAQFVRTVVEDGLASLVEKLAELTARPVAVETSDFKILAAHNMGPTPPSQQKTLTEEVAEELNRELRSSQSDDDYDPCEEAVRVGRRLVAPVVLEGAVVGYLSVMVRPSDNVAQITEILRPASVAALVDFSRRRREFSSTSVTHKSLLKDLLTGHNLAASDQERLEQYFGFDICDGFLLFAVRVTPDAAIRHLSIQERQPIVEMEGAHFFVVPLNNSTPRTWQEAAEELAQSLRSQTPDCKVQIGAGRPVKALLDLSDIYSEARQALITGSMIHSNNDFMISYGDLGIKRLLYPLLDHPELDRFYEENLAPLEAYDTEWETDLVATLRVYLNNGANLNSAAKELFIHRHTMRYRLEQIADLLKVDIDSSEVLLNLQIAFQIKDMKGKAPS